MKNITVERIVADIFLRDLFSQLPVVVSHPSFLAKTEDEKTHYLALHIVSTRGNIRHVRLVLVAQ